MIQLGTLEELPRRAADLAILCEIGDAMNSSVELKEVLNMVLVGVTAGQGLRFNRAFLLLVDEAEGVLRGSLATGPDGPEEAARIWSDLDRRRLSLRETLLTYSRELPHSGRHVGGIVQAIRIPLEEPSHLLVRVLTEGGARVVRRGEGSERSGDAIADQLGVDQFALVPISSRGGPIGVLIADNAITGRPIAEPDLHILRIFANHAGTAIEKARLYTRVREEKHALERAHRDLKHNQQTIIGLQRLSDLGEMAARVAHEIRNPLVSIGGFARRMLNETPEGDPRQRPLRIIVDEVLRLEGILQEVLDFSRPVRLESVCVPLERLVSGALEATLPEREAARAEVEVDLDPGCPEILADPGLLRIALVNVIRNAVQAVEREPAARRRIAVRSRKREGLAEISVEDTGPGIPLDVADRVFDPFFSTKVSGSGLGLAIVAQIMKEHGGRVRFESRPARRTTFYLDLPLEQGRVS